MRYVVYGLILLLLILHQDVWLWNNDRLFFGFMPAGLLYHALYSIAAAIVWAFAIVFIWPSDLEHFAEGGPPADSSLEGGSSGEA